MIDKEQYIVKKIPKPGDIIYIGTSLYLSHGRDDRIGGKVTVDRVEERNGQIWITLREFPGTSCNWIHYEPLQDSFKERFGDSWAYNDPDLRPEFNRWD